MTVSAEIDALPADDEVADENGLAVLVEFVLETTGSPVDTWAVAATLESRGLRDVDAVTRYSKRDIFDLADEVYALCRVELHARAGPRDPPPKAQWYVQAFRFMTFYLRGTFFAMPMAIQIISVLVLGYALWAYLKFSEAQATAVAVGTILSFVVTGGFVQAIGRLGLYYGEQESHVLAYQICYRLIKMGMIAAAGVGALWWVINLLSPSMAQETLAVSLVYYVLLSSLWLFMAVLYTLQMKLAIIASTSVGLIVIGAVLNGTGLGVYVAHWGGLALSNVIAFSLGFRVLRRKAGGVHGDMELAVLPRDSILMYSTGPYFAYGMCYFAFLFLDRVVAWSTAEEPLPFAIWFRTPYELGLDWALLSLVLTIALLEYTINEFSAIIIPVQKRFTAFERDDHNRYFRKFYRRQLAMLGALSVFSAWLTYVAVLSLRRFDSIKQARDFFASDTTFQVYWVGALGYALLVWALMNGVFFFCLSRPWLVLRAIVPAILVDVGVGFVASRVGSYWLAAFGLAAGALVFGLLTSRAMTRVLDRLDYFYYSAY
jgi:hypothetical protein